MSLATYWMDARPGFWRFFRLWQVVLVALSLSTTTLIVALCRFSWAYIPPVSQTWNTHNTLTYQGLTLELFCIWDGTPSVTITPLWVVPGHPVTFAPESRDISRINEAPRNTHLGHSTKRCVVQGTRRTSLRLFNSEGAGPGFDHQSCPFFRNCSRDGQQLHKKAFGRAQWSLFFIKGAPVLSRT